MKKLTAIDLCCGGGGWACAARGLPIEWVAVVDIAEDCLETWRINHGREYPDCKIIGADLSMAEGVGTVLLAVKNSKIDLVVGGIPCEPVSIARHCRGKASAATGETMKRWHKLIDNCLLLVRELAPSWWAIEDVIQIEKHLPTWFEHRGEIPFRRIEASEFGPQRRLRTFLGVFPDPVPLPRVAGIRHLCLGDVLQPGPHQTIPHYEQYKRHEGRGGVGNDKVRVLDTDAPSPTVLGALDRGSRQRRNFMVETADGRLRKLHWQEAARLQGFPEDFLFAAGLIRTQKIVGQAISIQVGRAILRAICEETELKPL